MSTNDIDCTQTNFIPHVIFSTFEAGCRRVLLKSWQYSAERAVSYEQIFEKAMRNNQIIGGSKMKIEEDAAGMECFQLFDAYARGLGIDQNPKDALKWVIKAAGGGNLVAAANLLQFHQALGEEFPRNKEIISSIRIAKVYGSFAAFQALNSLGIDDPRSNLGFKNLDKWTFDLLPRPGTSSSVFEGLQIIARIYEGGGTDSWSSLRGRYYTENRDTILHSLAIIGSVPDHIKACVEQGGISVNIQNSVGETPLFQAIRGRHYDTALALLRLGADASKCDEAGQSPMHCLCNSGSSVSELGTLISLLSKHGGNINAISRPSYNKDRSLYMHPRISGGAPLHYAIDAGNIRVAQVLLEHGADPLQMATVGLNGHIRCSAIDQAAKVHARELLESMIRRAPHYDFNSLSDHGDTLLKTAIGSDYLQCMSIHASRHLQAMRETISYIMQNTTKSRIDKYRVTPIYYAVLLGNPDVVKHILIVSGSDQIDIPCEANFTPLQISIQQGNKPVFDLLLQYGADPYRRLSDGSWNYLHSCAQQFGLDEYFPRTLLEKGLGKVSMAESMIIDPAPPVIYTAITHGNYGLATMLIERGHSINDPVSRRDPESVFCRIMSDSPDIHCIDFMFSLKGNQQPKFIISEISGSSILHRLAAVLSNPLDAALIKQVFSKTLSYFSGDAQVNFIVKLNNGLGQGGAVEVSPLHVAAAWGNLEAISELVKAGADLKAVAGNGKDALEIAEEVLDRGPPEDVLVLGTGAVRRWTERRSEAVSILQTYKGPAWGLPIQQTSDNSQILNNKSLSSGQSYENTSPSQNRSASGTVQSIRATDSEHSADKMPVDSPTIFEPPGKGKAKRGFSRFLRNSIAKLKRKPKEERNVSGSGGLTETSSIEVPAGGSSSQLPQSLPSHKAPPLPGKNSFSFGGSGNSQGVHQNFSNLSLNSQPNSGMRKPVMAENTTNSGSKASQVKGGISPARAAREASQGSSIGKPESSSSRPPPSVSQAQAAGSSSSSKGPGSSKTSPNGKDDDLQAAMEKYEPMISKSQSWWALCRKAQLLHVTAEARSEQDLQLCSFFYKYLCSADEADLPKLLDGSPFPKRTWQLVEEMMASIGDQFPADMLMEMRMEEEDHPAIKELTGREPKWWEENFFGEREAEKLRRYSPWRNGK
jgi:ankyrin repeat protein